MKTVSDDERGMGPANAYVAVLDIARRNTANEHNFTAAQKDLAYRVRKLAQAAHTFGKVYPPNFREHKIAVKVAGYRTRDRLSAEYAKLDAVCIANNITARLTNNNTTIIYEIK